MLRSPTVQTILLACLLLLTLVSLQHHKSYTADEVYELCNLSTNWRLVAASPDGFPPLYRWLLSQFVELLTPAHARLFSAITAVVGLLFVAAAGRSFGEAVGVRAALFFGFSACQLEYAQQVRAYSLYICLGAAVVWSAVNIVERQTISSWIGLVLSSVASLWTHYYAATFVIGVWLGILALGWLGPDSSRKYRKQFLKLYVLASISTAVLLIPLFDSLRIDLQNPPPIEAINPVDFTGIAYTYLTLLQGWCIGPSQLQLYEWNKGEAVLAIAPWAVLLATLLASVLYFALAANRARTDQGAKQSSIELQDRRKRSSLIWLITVIITVPLATVALALIAHSSFVPRYMAVLVVPISLVFGLGARLDRFDWQSIASWGLVLINLVSFTGRNFIERYDRENYRELTQFLKTQEEFPKLLVLSHYLGHAIAYQTDDSIELSMVGINSDEPDDWREIQLRLAEQFSFGSTLWIATDWMRPEDLRSNRRDQILTELGAKHVKRISGTLDLFVVADGLRTDPPAQTTRE
jgi:uncharacterized membrane protein